MSAREDLELIQEHLTLQIAYQDAKANGLRESDPEAFAAAKAAYGEHRRFWRQIREYRLAELEQEWRAGQAALEAQEA